MLSLIFTVMMIVIFGKLALFALKATWGITKVVCTIILFPAVLVILAVSGCMFIALPVLMITGVALIVKSAFAGV